MPNEWIIFICMYIHINKRFVGYFSVTYSKDILCLLCQHAKLFKRHFFFVFFNSLRGYIWYSAVIRAYTSGTIRLKKSRSTSIRGLLTPRWMDDEVGHDWMRSNRVAVFQRFEMENHERGKVDRRLRRRLEPFILDVIYVS